MTGPMPFHKFKQLVQRYGCSVVRTTKEWRVVDKTGKAVSGFAVTHGKKEVKPVYVNQFLKAAGGKIP